jgi:Uri superfamily endonuclease
MTGMYVILAELGLAKEIQVGKKQRFVFEKGFYAYVGSALAGLERRVARHLSTRKKLHWHIDYLLNSATVRTVICAETRQKEECLIARSLAQRLPTISDFGCNRYAKRRQADISSL